MTVFDCLDPVSRRAGMDAATTAARGGRLVVLPTDTVYGIGADAFNANAVRSLLAAKGRGPDMPVPVLIGSSATLAGLVSAVPPRAKLLIDAFWPGGLSIILEHAPSLAWNLGDTRNTVMVRMPLHPVALELLRAVGPMAVSSANISGLPPATSAEQAVSQLSDSVGVYLDAGPSPVGVASTVVDLTGEVPVVRRVGAISVERLREVLPEIAEPPHEDDDSEPADRTSRIPLPDPDEDEDSGTEYDPDRVSEPDMVEISETAEADDSYGRHAGQDVPVHADPVDDDPVHDAGYGETDHAQPDHAQQDQAQPDHADADHAGADYDGTPHPDEDEHEPPSRMSRIPTEGYDD